MDEKYVFFIKKGKYFQGWGHRDSEAGGINNAIRYSKRGMESNLGGGIRNGWKAMRIMDDGKLEEVRPV
jgi:hypothetical protein